MCALALVLVTFPQLTSEGQALRTISIPCSSVPALEREWEAYRAVEVGSLCVGQIMESSSRQFLQKNSLLQWLCSRNFCPILTSRQQPTLQTLGAQCLGKMKVEPC